MQVVVTTIGKFHTFDLPSIEEGLALVQAQAMACGCPVIAAVSTGAEDLFTNGTEGYLISPRDSVALTERLQYLEDHPEVRSRFSEAALQRVRRIGGWDQYGDSYAALLTRSNKMPQATAKIVPEEQTV